MNTPAIYQALRLEKHPEEMVWTCHPNSDLPEGMTDLLRLCASKELLLEFAEKNEIDAEPLFSSLINFIQKAVVNNNNSDEKILGTDSFASLQLQNFHYQLLMKIFNPETNPEPQFAELAASVSNAYQRLQEKEKEQEIIRFSEHRESKRNFHATTKQTETPVSHIKTAIALISAITICVLVAMTGKLQDPANPELISTNDSPDLNQNGIAEIHNLVKITNLKTDNILHDTSTIKASSTDKLQYLLKNLESAYEQGEVATILPILANTPEIKDQTNKQLHDKLKTLFEITTERKMVLFDFKWTNIAGTIQGQGKFLSRYLLVGEKKWLTREGKASVSATITNNKLKVTQLSLENQSIE